MLQLADLNPKKYPEDRIIESNLLVLYQRLKVVEALWVQHIGVGVSDGFICTSGLRSQTQQSNLIKAGKSNAVHSKHLNGMAADILDEDGAIKAWLFINTDYLIDNSLWCEAPDACPNWIHFQIAPPASGKRWFEP